MAPAHKNKPALCAKEAEHSEQDNPVQGRPLDGLFNHESAFRAFLRRRLHDDVIAEDLLQQNLLRAVEHHHTLQNNESIMAWFRRILCNAVVDYYRTRAAENRKLDGFQGELRARGEQAVPSPGEMKPIVYACPERVLPTIRAAYAELLRRIDLQGDCPTPADAEPDLGERRHGLQFVSVVMNSLRLRRVRVV